MSKTPTIEEIRNVQEKHRSFAVHKDWAAFSEDYPRPVNEVYCMISLMALPLMEAADSNEEATVWKFIKKLKKYSFCPVKPAEYKRMQEYAENPVIVDTVRKAIRNVGYPFSKDDILPDIISFYYCIALLSQSKVNREECLEVLKFVLEEAGKKKKDGEIKSFGPMMRNMNVLAKEYDDLSELQSFVNKLEE